MDIYRIHISQKPPAYLRHSLARLRLLQAEIPEALDELQLLSRVAPQGVERDERRDQRERVAHVGDDEVHVVRLRGPEHEDHRVGAQEAAAHRGLDEEWRQHHTAHGVGLPIRRQLLRALKRLNSRRFSCRGTKMHHNLEGSPVTRTPAKSVTYAPHAIQSLTHHTLQLTRHAGGHGDGDMKGSS